MDIVTKKLINILIQLAEADKHFAKAEREMIFKIAKEKNFPEASVTELIKNPEPIETLGALSQEQKFEYLYTTIELIFADHNIFDSEVLFCKNVAIKLGFKKGIIDYFLEHYGRKTREEFKAVAMGQFL
ncbi:MAG: TerB family tellurite resistance protein [Cyclobacteriaceae bacterium]|nr:TerB family tellurite resistance protein [Cyclobacteriaceae bacterium]UYN88026.1 MAG: TerB family tellurite resistance protein [Cyclobacteriaceae bacterium]